VPGDLDVSQMNHIYANRTTTMQYSINVDGILSIESGVIKNTSTVDLKVNKPKSSEGLCALPGAFGMFGILMAGCCTLALMMQDAYIQNNIIMGIGILAGITVIAAIFVWYKFGFFAIGTRVVFQNGEKFYVYRGSNWNSYNDLVSVIKKFG